MHSIRDLANTFLGQRFAPSLGVGYINELVARLTDSPVDDQTSTNSTVTADPATFPLGNRVYVVSRETVCSERYYRTRSLSA